MTVNAADAVADTAPSGPVDASCVCVPHDVFGRLATGIASGTPVVIT